MVRFKQVAVAALALGLAACSRPAPQPLTTSPVEPPTPQTAVVAPTPAPTPVLVDPKAPILRPGLFDWDWRSVQNALAVQPPDSPTQRCTVAQAGSKPWVFYSLPKLGIVSSADGTLSLKAASAAAAEAFLRQAYIGKGAVDVVCRTHQA